MHVSVQEHGADGLLSIECSSLFTAFNMFFLIFYLVSFTISGKWLSVFTCDK